MNGDASQTDPTDPQLPGPLRAELSRVYRVDASAVPEVDQKILSRARAHFAGRRRLRLWLEVGAVAAVILLVIGIVLPMLTRTDRGYTSGPVASQQIADVNGDGVVDIRDALLLARKLESGTVSGRDVNHDGVTDRRDVDAIAMMSVRLNAGGTTR
jgi:hypothetical protein